MITPLTIHRSKSTAQVVRCPHCLQPYTLGIDGTVTGCDVCEQVIRNKFDGSIIPTEWDAMTAEDVDALTDMEKA